MQHLEAGLLHARDRGAQQLDRVGPGVARISIGEVFADVAERARPQHGVDHRVRQHIRIGVALKPELMLELDTADHEPPSRDKPVRVVADPGRRTHRARCASSNSAICRSSRVVIFMLLGNVCAHHPHDPSRLLHQPGVVGGAGKHLVGRC